MNINAIVIYPDSTFTVGPTDASLKGLQTIVGGYIEAVNAKDTTMFVNEEGKLNGSEFNPLATALWWTLAPYMTGVDALFGPVVVLGPVDANGDETAVSADTLNVLADVLFGTIFGDDQDEEITL